MGLRDLVNKGKCLIGLHDGEWRAASPTTCTYTRTCIRCSARHTKVEHPWSDWRFITDAACEQQRDCRRCGLAEQRVLHSYGIPAFVSDDRCERQEVCNRCRDSRALATQHSMNAWHFVQDDDCRQLQHCTRCHEAGTLSRTEHDWDNWQPSTAHAATVRVCRRCGELQVQAAPPDAAPLSSYANPQATTTLDSEKISALVGRWRHTEIMSSGDFSLVTDTHLVLQQDGRWQRWARTVSGMGKQMSDPVTGNWHAADGVLYSRIDGGAEAGVRYRLDGKTLFLPDGNAAKRWERVG